MIYLDSVSGSLNVSQEGGIPDPRFIYIILTGQLILPHRQINSQQ